MSTTPTVFSSTDVGAPVLSGSPGALAAILDAILVDGYGDKAPLGWIRAFSDGHKRVFRNDTAVGATGYCIRFDDSGSPLCLVTAYESMSDVNTGINQFSATAAEWQKSLTADGVARQWMAIGTERCVYLFINNGGIEAEREVGWFFGDMVPFGAADAWVFAYSNSHVQSGVRLSGLAADGTTAALGNGMQAARSYDGVTIGPNVKNRPSLLSGMHAFGTTYTNSGLPYPYPSTNAALISSVIVLEGTIFRARMPGIWVAEHSNIHNEGTIYTGFSGPPPGTELLCKFARSNRVTNQRSNVLIDITNPWY